MNGFARLIEALNAMLVATAAPSFVGLLSVFLGVVFLASGSSKVRQPERAALALAEFGVLRSPTALHGALLGVAELGLGAALVIGLSPVAALTAAAILLWFFGVALARELASGRATPCYCFGDDDTPIRRVTVIRTATLAVVATAAAALSPSAITIVPTVFLLQLVGGLATFATALLLSKVMPTIALMAHHHGGRA